MKKKHFPLNSGLVDAEPPRSNAAYPARVPMGNKKSGPRTAFVYYLILSSISCFSPFLYSLGVLPSVRLR